MFLRIPKRKIIRGIMKCSIFILTALFPATVMAYSCLIQPSGEYEYKAVRLTPAVYSNSNRNLSDILILDEGGNPVPYFINNYNIIKTHEKNSIYSLIASDYYIKDGSTYNDFYVESDERTDVLATSITIETDSKMFARNIELKGSYDGIVWDSVKNDKLYRVDENEKLTIAFDKPLKYTHYRFIAFNNAGKENPGDMLIINAANLEFSRSTVNKALFTQAYRPEYEIEDQQKVTLIKLHGLKNVKINQVEIETDSQFKRSVQFAGSGFKMLYNLYFGDSFYQTTGLDFNGYSESSDVLEIKIINGDDKPVNINNITLTYFTDEVIFKSEPGKTYTISFGNSSISNPPVYDIANYRDLILAQGYDVLLFDNVKEIVVEDVHKADYSTAFNAVIIAVSVLLGFIILVRLKRAPSDAADN